MSEDIKRLELEIAKLKLQQGVEQVGLASKPKSSFSIGWFIFWLIIFWPVALVMVVYHGFKGK